MFASWRLVDLWAGGRVRAAWRCPRRCVPLRIHHGGRWRYYQSLLWGCRLLDRSGSRQHSWSLGLVGCQRILRTAARIALRNEHWSRPGRVDCGQSFSASHLPHPSNAKADAAKEEKVNGVELGGDVLNRPVNFENRKII